MLIAAETRVIYELSKERSYFSPGKIWVLIFLANWWNFFSSQFIYVICFWFLIYLHTYVTKLISFIRQDVPTNRRCQRGQSWKKGRKENMSQVLFTWSESSIDKLVEINNKLTTNHVPLKYGTKVSFYRFPN